MWDAGLEHSHCIDVSCTGPLPSSTPYTAPLHAHYVFPMCPRDLQPIRLLAVVVAKNAVGSSWRKTLGTREWSRVPDSEKAMVREGAMQLLLNGEGGRLDARAEWPGCQRSSIAAGRVGVGDMQLLTHPL